jgi:hypothetical protein
LVILLNYRDLSAEDLQEMMKLRRLGMDLRQYIRYTFQWFMETTYIDLSKSSLPQKPQGLDTLENVFKLRKSVVL